MMKASTGDVMHDLLAWYFFKQAKILMQFDAIFIALYNLNC